MVQSPFVKYYVTYSGVMSTTQETNEIQEPSKKISPESQFLYPPSETKFIEDMKKSVSRYRQSIESYQQDWIRALKNNFELVEKAQNEYVQKSDTTLSAIETSTRIIRALNEYAKAYAELNQTLVQTWISSWSPKTD